MATQTGHRLAAESTRGQNRWRTAPLRLALLWLIGTLVVFFFTEPATRLPAVWPMLIVASAGCVALTVGYLLQTRKHWDHQTLPEPRVPKQMIVVSSAWACGYGLAYLNVYGLLDPNALATAILNPGQAYASKFLVFEELTSAEADRFVQLITLSAGLLTLSLPLTIVWWEQLPNSVRALGVVGALAYLLPFLGVGTNQGLAYSLALILTGIMVRSHSRRNLGLATRLSTASKMTIIAASIALVAFFVVGAIQRQEAFQQASTPTNPVVTAVVGPELARALNSAVFYPTHGYLGLAETLTQPPAWTQGYGGSKALNRYLVNYLGFEDQTGETYPARTQNATGYPADLIWHTVYPWLASDLTFVGAVLLLAGVGWLLSSTWSRSVKLRDPLAIGLLGWLAIFIAFIPANNQIGMSQVNLIGLLTLLALYCARPLFRLRNNPPTSYAAPNTGKQNMR